MSDNFQQTVESLMPALSNGELGACEEYVIKKIRELPRSPFDLSVEVNITNAPGDAAKDFDRFFAIESERMTIAAAYTEMNGFYINPDLWFCNLFAFTSYGGHDDYDWLAEWQSQDFPRYVIRGLEPLQAVYANEYSNEVFRDAEQMSSLLVVIKFQRFIVKATSQMRLLRFPLLVTAHDFDFISEVRPGAS